METQKNAISWFEIPVLDFERAKTFFEKLYLYTMPVENIGPFAMGYLPSETGEDAVGGAIIANEGYTPVGHGGAKIYLNGGSDLQNILSRVEAAGGKVVMPKTQITPEIGYMAFFEDTEGNVLGLYSRA